MDKNTREELVTTLTHLLDGDPSDRTNRFMLSAAMSKQFEWDKWIHEIPFLPTKPGWQVKVVPPFHGAMVRFWVRRATTKKDDRISVYLDCYGLLGMFDMAESPYWEVYPCEVEGPGNKAVWETERVAMNDVDELIRVIDRALDAHEDPMKKIGL